MEVRYVGNHVVKMLRGVDFNQIKRQSERLRQGL